MTQTLAAVEEQPAQSVTQNPARIAIIGGGVTGGVVLTEAVDHYIERLKDNTNLPPLRIDFFEAGGQNGYGTSYDLETVVFRLNQPAQTMSLHSDRSGHFIEWLKKREDAKNISEVAAAREKVRGWKAEGLSEMQIAHNHRTEYLLARNWTQHDFVPRALFRHYLLEQYEATIHRSREVNLILDRQAITINTINAFVDQLKQTNSGEIVIGVKIRGEERSSTLTDSVVIATGHHKNGILKELRPCPAYAETPIPDMHKIESVLAANAGSPHPVFILGTSQSMLDIVGGLDAAGYKGSIVAASSRGIEPWPYDPAKHIPLRTDYPLQHVTEEKILAIFAEHGTDVRKAIGKFCKMFGHELQAPEAREMGPGHVISTFLAQKDKMRAMMACCPGFYEECLSLVDQFDTNHTFPERFETYLRYKESGQLKIVAARVDTAKTVARSDGHFDVALSSGTIVASAFFNCGSLHRATFNQKVPGEPISVFCPLGQRAYEAGLVEGDSKTKMLIPHSVLPAGKVETAGPARGGSWGVPYTVADCHASAHKVVDYAIEMAQKIQQAAPAVEL